MTQVNYMNSELIQAEDFLQKLAWKYAQNQDDAKDLLQDTICKALEKTNYFKRGSNFKAWISVVMRNIFINAYRKKKRQPIFSIEENHSALNDYRTESNAEQSIYTQEITGAIQSWVRKTRMS